MTERYWVRFALVRSACFYAVVSVLLSSAFETPAQQAHDACDLLPKVSVPEQDRPTFAEAASANVPLPASANRDRPPWDQATTACYSVSLYYSHSPEHFQKARYCVLATLGLLRDTVDLAKVKAAQRAASGGATDPEDIDEMDGMVLAMVYGNGEGVARNLPLARQFVCQYAGGIESDEPAQLLKGFDKIVSQGGHYDVCDNSGGSYGRRAAYVCLGLQQDKRAEEIRQLEVAITATSTPQLKVSFLALSSVWQTFHKAYGTMDVAFCDGGTGCGPITENDDLKVTASWLAALKDVQNGVAPASDTDPSTFSQLDRNLNANYHNALDEFKGCEGEPCLTAQIRNADRAWLKYREAWVQFGALRWPSIPAEQWRAWQAAIWAPLLSGN
jgi:hypothetical protein